jgi:hypothetical protein
VFSKTPLSLGAILSRALAPDHLGIRGLRPLPEADRMADSGGHPRFQVATRRLGAPGLHRHGLLYCEERTYLIALFGRNASKNRGSCPTKPLT